VSNVSKFSSFGSEEQLKEMVITLSAKSISDKKGNKEAMSVLPHISEWDISKTDINKLFAILAEEKQ